MGRYLGIKCVSCGDKFSQTDDVVVCPVCGAPHHRNCYKEKGECALNANHAKGIAWVHPLDKNKGSNKNDGLTVNCKVCGTPNNPDGIFCSDCGERLSQKGSAYTTDISVKPVPSQQYKPQYKPAEYGETSDRQQYAKPSIDPSIEAGNDFARSMENYEIEGVPVKDISIFVGNNFMYYLPRFKAIATGKSYLAVSFSAFFLNFFYFFYRKMYLIGGVLLAAALIMFVPSAVYASEYVKLFMQSVSGIVIPYNQALMDQMAQIQQYTNMFQFGISFVLGMFGNKLYYNHVMKSIKNIRVKHEEHNNNNEYYAELAYRGRTDMKLTTVISVGLVIGYFALAFLISKGVPPIV